MDSIELTKDSDILICALYKTYLERRKEGMRKIDARVFLSPEWIQLNIIPKWDIADIADTCRELSELGLVECGYGDDEICLVALTTDSIIYMETRFKSSVSAILGYLEKLRIFLPW